MEIVFECPICKAIQKDPDPEFQVVSTQGMNYWCCSSDCRDIARSVDTDLPFHDTKFLDDDGNRLRKAATRYRLNMRLYAGDALYDLAWAVYRLHDWLYKLADRIFPGAHTDDTNEHTP